MPTLEESILINQPFQHVLGRIKKVESLFKEGRAISGKTFRVFDANLKQYKLHYADSLRKAVEIEQNVTKVPSIFPEYYGRQGRFLLFAWIKGRTLTKEEKPEVYEKVGRLCADVHNANSVQGSSFKKGFYRWLECLPVAIFTPMQKQVIAEQFENLREKVRVSVQLDLRDLHQGNCIIDEQERVFFVDEGGLLHSAKGLGFAKPFLTWFSPEARAAFWKGYTEKHSGDYFDRAYEELMTLMSCVQIVGFRALKGQPQQNYAKEVEWLKKNR